MVPPHVLKQFDLSFGLEAASNSEFLKAPEEEDNET